MSSGGLGEASGGRLGIGLGSRGAVPRLRQPTADCPHLTALLSTANLRTCYSDPPCSWSFVQQELADALGAVVTAHDMPGFGLSQRCASAVLGAVRCTAMCSRIHGPVVLLHASCS